MSFEDRAEIATTKFNQLINFIKEIEINNYCDPKQFYDAKQDIETLLNEFNLLKFKLDYLSHGYLNDFLEEVA